MSRTETGRTGARFGAPARRARHHPDPDHPHGHPRTADPDDLAAGSTPEDRDPAGQAAGTEVGLTGARFGGRTRRSARERRADRAVGATEPAARPPAPAARATPPGDAVPVPPPGPAERTAELPRIVDDAPEVTVAARPYVLTGGRTKVRAELRIETMVSAVPGAGPPVGDSGERYAVLRLCSRARSVSEVAALANVPLGVARVLIDDLVTEGRLRVHLGVDPAGGPDLELLDRVLSGLRRL